MLLATCYSLLTVSRQDEKEAKLASRRQAELDAALRAVAERESDRSARLAVRVETEVERQTRAAEARQLAAGKRERQVSSEQ